MGCYDSILVPCPKCGELYEAQSKSGDCHLRVYDFDDTPPDVMENVNRHAPFTCLNCGAIFCVEFNPKIKIVETNEILNDCPIFSEHATKDELKKTIEDYFSKLDSK